MYGKGSCRYHVQCLVKLSIIWDFFSLCFRVSYHLHLISQFLFLQSNVAASNAKLALFYDWLFFDPERDSIMNIGE